MVKINKIYTRTGDDGSTGLVGGERIMKDSLRVAAYGDVDELNSSIALPRTLAEKLERKSIAVKLERIQQELFDVGAELATPPKSDLSSLPTITENQVTRLEQWIDEVTETVPELRSFVLPGGTELNSALHVARAVCRRCERTVRSLSRVEPVSDPVLHYLNRLSDLLFALARFESHTAKTAEYLWKPGSGR